VFEWVGLGNFGSGPNSIITLESTPE
jgi:hypothetical protein